MIRDGHSIQRFIVYFNNGKNTNISLIFVILFPQTYNQ